MAHRTPPNGFPAMRTHDENTVDVLPYKRDPNTPEAKVAIGRVLEAYRGTIYAISLARVRNVQQAEELAQDVIVHAYQKISHLGEPRALAGWLRRMTHNMASNQQTRQKAFASDDSF